MGGIAAMNSINRVMEAHGDEIQKEWAEQVPDNLRDTFTQVILEGKNYGIQVEWEFRGGATLQGPFIDIDELAERFPDCNVAY